MQYKFKLKKSTESFNLFVNVFSFLTFILFAVDTRLVYGKIVDRKPLPVL